ncbi:MAG: hypothetical protein AAF402_04595 [Pseudomonadota bacterium]
MICSVSSGDETDWVAVWSAAGERSLDVYFRKSSEPEETRVLTNDNLNQYTPVVAKTDRGAYMVVWSEETGVLSSDLRFVTIDTDTTSQVQTIPASADQNAQPTLITDDTGRIWCVWVGFDGSDDELYFSHYYQGKWADGRLVDAEPNEVPDLVPEARLVGSSIRLTWKRFDLEAGAYVAMSSALDLGAPDRDWVAPETVVKNPFEFSNAFPEGFNIPRDIEHIESLALHIESDPSRVFHVDRMRLAPQTNLD